ncbi:AbrB/MazE/SpoVT family DNA-binding domain-containing protein [bacterium]|nr:AbrB/MazE/SpoVT family DNA-binding domain-containing protein [bacterium]
MSSTGIVRRIDELGRIVIPKEVRKRLRMDSGDLVDISVDSENVVLSKFHPLDQDQQIIASLCDSLNATYQIDLIVTNLQKVIYTTLENELVDEALDKEFLKRVPSYLDKEISSLNRITLTKDFIIPKDCICYEIMIENELFGYLILLDGMISKKQKDLANFILHYFDNFFK